MKVHKVTRKKKIAWFPFMRGWNLSNRIAFIGLLVSVIGIFVAIISLGQQFFTRKHEITASTSANPADSIEGILQTKQSELENERVDSVKRSEPDPNSIKQFFIVKLFVNSDLSNARILVDNKPASIMRNDLLVKTIKVKRKDSPHRIALIAEDDSCETSILITHNYQEVNICPN